jgi:hypothetical protein
LFLAPLWALIFLAILAGKPGDLYRLSVAAQPAREPLSKAQRFVPTYPLLLLLHKFAWLPENLEGSQA